MTSVAAIIQPGQFHSKGGLIAETGYSSQESPAPICRGEHQHAHSPMGVVALPYVQPSSVLSLLL